MQAEHPCLPDRSCAQIDALYAKYFGFSNSPVIVASSATAFACATTSAPGAKYPCGGWCMPNHGVRARSSTRSNVPPRSRTAREKSIAPTSPHAATHLRCDLQRSRSTW